MPNNTLYQAVSFRISPTDVQSYAIGVMSDSLRSLWNMAVLAREHAYNQHLAPLYASLAEAQKHGDKTKIAALKQALTAAKQDPEVAQNSNSFAQQKHLLTPLRAARADMSAVPRAFQICCLDTLDASFKSYYELKKHGDAEAKRPKLKPDHWFQEIGSSNPTSFQIDTAAGCISLSCNAIASKADMTFPIPDYQRNKLVGKRIKKVIVTRNKRGVYMLNVVYEFPAPDPVPDIPTTVAHPGNTLFIALGTSALAVLAPPLQPGENWREELIQLPRPDMHWKPLIDAVSARMRPLFRKDSETQSKRYRKLKAARAAMFDKLAGQQKLGQREMAQRLLGYGPYHIVLTELVVRSQPGKLADSSQSERRGTLGANWAAQNTGWLDNLVAQMRIKASERGTRVETFKVDPPHPRNADFRERKLAMARLLRDRYLTSRSV